MKSAGLTHGGFYGHFDSKEDLAAQACARALSASAKCWSAVAEGGSPGALADILRAYLSTSHRDAPGGGCVFAALGPEAALQQGPVRRAFTEGLQSFIFVLMKLVPGRTKAAQRERALATMPGIVGALILAMAVDDPALSEALLRAAAVTFGGPSAERSGRA